MKVTPSACGHDCGGNCPLNVYVEDGKIVKIEARDTGYPAMKPCARGLLYHYRVYAPDRLKYPMKRVGERGEGKFKRVSWDEALDEVASQLTRIRDTYGPASILNLSYSGALGRLHYACVLARFLNMAGGQIRRWGGTSFQGALFASLATYGSLFTGNERADLLNSKMIILWGANPAETVFGTETRYFLMQAKEKGTKIISIDPRFTDSAAAWASEWIPIRPGTDAAMLVAMAYVITKEGLHDQHYIDTYTVGFDKFKDYFTGVEDGIAKTPEWAEKITGVPAETIRRVAKEYAAAKPAAIISGFSPGRTSRGEQFHRATTTLSAMTGNIGIHGGATACFDLSSSVRPKDESKPGREYYGDIFFDLPEGENAVDKGGLPLHQYAMKGIRTHTVDKVHPAKMWDAILKGKAGGYFSDIKLAYVTGSNALNQFSDTNKAVQAFKKLEFIVVHDQFMTPTAKFADILLPACTFLERNEITFPWFFGLYAQYASKAIEPLYESKSDLDILTLLAKKMGISGYSDKSDEEWLKGFVPNYGIDDYEGFKASGFYKMKTEEPFVAFQNQIKDPEHFKFATPSGKIEIYCQRIADYNHTDELPPVPKYVEGWEGVSDPLRKKYPLQILTIHPPRRNHSQFDNVSWYRQRQAREIWINPVDARPRNIKDRDEVKVFNDRGALSIAAKVTHRIIPGVISIYEGAWYDPDPTGLDRGGCSNVLSRDEHSPGGAFASNTGLVQVEKLERRQG